MAQLDPNQQPASYSDQGQDFSPEETDQSQDNEQSYQQSDASQLLPGPEPEYLVLEWMADSRYVRPRTRQYYSSILVLGILFSILLFAANQIALIILLWALIFLSYVLARVKPENVGVQITTYGIRYQEQLIFWDEMTRFWVKEIHGFQQIHIEVPNRIFRQLILLPSNAYSVNEVEVEDIANLVGRVVPYEEPIPNRFDMWVQWVERKFPLESEPIPPANEVQAQQTQSPQQMPPVAPVQQPPTAPPDSR